MIDIHSHILPGLDDGSRSMDKSIAMAEIAVEAGVTDMIATPHCNQRKLFENYASTALFDGLDKLKNELEAAGIDINIYLGAEVFATEDIIPLYKDKRLFTLNFGRYMLVEFDFYAELEFMENTLYDLLDEDVVPILAHPERYVMLQEHPEAAMIWHDEGVGIQLNKGSLFRRFGSGAYHLARYLLDSGHVSCIASDAHGTEHRTPDMTDVEILLTDMYSESTADLLLQVNPWRILNNKKLLNMDNLERY